MTGRKDFTMAYKTYIAYGSNINTEQMSHRCPEACVIGTSVVPDHKLVFRGRPDGAVATIEPAKGSSVPVLVWEISKQDERNLDIYEGFPRFYVKKDYQIELEGKTVTAMAYIMTPGHVEGIPSRYYFNVIAEGYREFGFDLAFLQKSAGVSYDRSVSNPKARLKEYAARQKNRTFTACPRCGGWMRRELYMNCLSRRANIYICEKCGMAEALADFAQKADPVTDWYIFG